MIQHSHPSAGRKVRIVNLGCSKNQVDSESILGEFGRAGFSLARPGDISAVTLLNTCGFIEPAKEESIQEILDAIRSRGPGEKIVVAGCLSQRYMKELQTDIPEADLFVGTYKPGEILERLGLTSTLPSDCKVGASPRTLMGEEPHHAFLKIAEGCNRVCGFCAIPGMRGKQKSRTIADLVMEARQLESWGVKEISLIAQDLTYFGREAGGRENLEQLLQALLKETGVSWFRLMYAYPAFLTDGLLETMAVNPRICKYLDMPVQHASDRMLKAMRRNYDSADLRAQIGRLYAAMPSLSLRTTVLAGYPGETETDFQELLDFVGETEFRHLGGFVYSDEDETHAFNLAEKVPPDIARERLDRLMDLQRQIASDENQARIGTMAEVIIDSPGTDETSVYLARTEGDAPEVDGRVLITGKTEAEIGTFRRVKITGSREFDLEAELLPA